MAFTYEFPPEFIASRNPKWIVIEECKATFKNQLVGNVLLHASFIHRDHYLDHACCFVNEEANKDTAKYEYNSNVARFELWFTDLHGEPVDMELTNINFEKRAPRLPPFEVYGYFVKKSFRDR